MSSTDGEIGMKNLTDKATYERLEKDVAAVKNDISALADQITDVLNSFAGTAKNQARRGYKQARANAEQAVDDMSERGSAMMDAAQDAATSIEETLEDVITQRPLATVVIGGILSSTLLELLILPVLLWWIVGRAPPDEGSLDEGSLEAL